MTDVAAVETRQCWRCGADGGADAGAGLVCARCEAPQALPSGVDLFAILGLPRGLVIDAADLEQRYHAASRAVHPDRHQTSDAKARELSLAAGAAVNRAYRTLRDPIAAGRYWLELHGERLGNENRVPPALAALVFETQETLEELRDAGGSGPLRDRVVAVKGELMGRLASLQSELTAHYAEWMAVDPGAPPVIAELKRRLSEIAYLRTLLADVDAALGD
jgi:molecular chaperone HscB